MADDTTTQDVPQASDLPAPPTLQNIAPMLTQISGGDPGSTVALAQGAKDGYQSAFGDIGKIVGQVTAQLQQVFQSGVGVGAAKANSSNPQDIVNQTNQLAATQGAATMAAGIAKANVTAMDGLAAAAAASQTKSAILNEHLDQNNPQTIQEESQRATASDMFHEQIGKVLDMRKVGFFDNPAEYLINHIINLPIAEGKARDALGTLGEITEKQVADAKSIGARSAIDTAFNSKDTVDRAAQLYTQALGEATALGIDPLIKAQQTKIGAYELGVAQQNEGINAARLGIEKTLLPGQLAQQKASITEAQTRTAQILDQMDKETKLLPGQLKLQQFQTEYYKAYKESSIQAMDAKAAELTQARVDRLKADARDAEQLRTLNSLRSSLGITVPLDDANKITKESLIPQVIMGQNMESSESIGQSPLQAYLLLKKSELPLNKMPDGHKLTFRALDSVYNQSVMDAEIGGPNGTRVPNESMNAFVANRFNNYLLSDINQPQAGNKFFEPPSVTTLAAAPWAKDNLIVQSMKPLGLDGSGAPIKRTVDGSAILNTAAQLIEDGKIDAPNAVRMINEIGRKLQDDMQTVAGWKRFAFPVPDRMNMPFQLPSAVFGAGTTQSVDLLNSADIAKKLQMQSMRIKVQNLTAAGAGVGP